LEQRLLVVKVANARVDPMKLFIRTAQAPSLDISYQLRWEGADQGLITAWASGIALGESQPDLAAAALRGELPVLPFKGGIEKAIEAKSKLGALHYLAMWQGLRNEPLNIDTECENQLVCTKTNVTVVFTLDTKRLLATGSER
jgi:hypothetical protein